MKGIASTVYEGSARAGGRCYSLRGYFDDGIVVEHGGALINTDHNATRNLASNLGLSLDVVAGGSYQGWDDKYWIDGADYPYDDANDDWGAVYQAFKSALASAPYCQTYDNHTAAGVALDQHERRPVARRERARRPLEPLRQAHAVERDVASTDSNRTSSRR